MDIEDNNEENKEQLNSGSNNVNEKKEKFVIIAERRINEVVKKIQLLGNLSNKSNYDYDDEQVQQLFDVLEGELQNLKVKFRLVKTEKKSSFSFKSS